MRIFVSAGEPSGDIHGANLIRELKARRTDLDGFAAAAWSVRRDGVDDEWVRTERDRRRGRLIEVLHELVAAAAWSVRGEVKVVFAFTVEDGLIREIELLADCLDKLDLASRPIGRRRRGD